MDPVVFEVKPPKSPFRLPRLPRFSDHANKLVTVVAAIVVSISMVSFVAYTFITNSSSFKKSHGMVPASTVPGQTSGVTPSAASLPGGGQSVGLGGTTGTNSPVVTITTTPSSVVIGGQSHLVWSVTNNPSSCTASDDWSGGKAASGSEDTPRLSKAQTYMFTLTCQNATGTGFATVSVGTISQGGSGSAGRPTVRLAANPSAVYRGDKSTLIWSSTGNPSSCTASGDWNGGKAIQGSENTAILSVAKTYSYTLTCKNSAGTGFATAKVSAITPPANLPVISMSTDNLGAVKPGAVIKITWSTNNSPTSCVASGDWSGSKPGRGTQSLGPLNTPKTYTFKLTCSNSAGSGFDSVPVQVLPDPPKVSLSASPTQIQAGGHAWLAWSATNAPTSCTASGDWSGSKAASGLTSTGTLTVAKTYLYNLSCSNAAGTGYVNNVAVTVNQVPAPTVNISTNPIATTTGNSATVSWSTGGNPTSCSASGDWSGSKASSGSQGTGTLNSARTYTYRLTCSNAGGSTTGTATINVTSSAPPAQRPVVTITANPTSIGTGSSSTISWSVANNPTSCSASGDWSGSKSASGSTNTGPINSTGMHTYALSCSNSAGSDSASAYVSVSATPSVNLSISPSTITAGASATLSWNVGGSPNSCTAGGDWSGSKASSGSQTISPGSAGNYNYTLTCSNSVGSGSDSVSLTVNQPTSNYCNGRTPCIGRSQLAQHDTTGDCWGYNIDWVIDISSYAPHHKGGTKAGNLAYPGVTCNASIAPALSGSPIPNYTASGGKKTYDHNNCTKSNCSSSQLRNYFMGYWDPNKP